MDNVGKIEFIDENKELSYFYPERSWEYTYGNSFDTLYLTSKGNYIARNEMLRIDYTVSDGSPIALILKESNPSNRVTYKRLTDKQAVTWFHVRGIDVCERLSGVYETMEI